MSSSVAFISQWFSRLLGKSGGDIEQHFQHIAKRREETALLCRQQLEKLPRQTTADIQSLQQTIQLARPVVEQIDELKKLGRLLNAATTWHLADLEHAVAAALATIADLLTVHRTLQISPRHATVFWALFAADYLASVAHELTGKRNAFGQKFSAGVLPIEWIAQDPKAATDAFKEIGIDIEPTQRGAYPEAENMYQFIWREIVPKNIRHRVNLSDLGDASRIQPALLEIAVGSELARASSRS